MRWFSSLFMQSVWWDVDGEFNKLKSDHLFFTLKGEMFSMLLGYSHKSKRRGLGLVKILKPTEYTFGSLISTANDLYSSSEWNGLCLLEQMLVQLWNLVFWRFCLLAMVSASADQTTKKNFQWQQPVYVSGSSNLSYDLHFEEVKEQERVVSILKVNVFLLVLSRRCAWNNVGWCLVFNTWLCLDLMGHGLFVNVRTTNI